MARSRKNLAMSLLIAALITILLVGEAMAANGGNGKGEENGGGKDEGKGKGEGDGKGKGKGKGEGEGEGKGKGGGKGDKDDGSETDYVELGANPMTGQESFLCMGAGSCHKKTITCPAECPERKPKKGKGKGKGNKGCKADCSSRCETTCKYRKPKCDGYGSICYDPRFVGGDGVMFYFHGAKGGDFALVSDDDLHINAHFIGSRPRGRARDFTWVQALAVMFESHSLVVAAKRVSTWDENFDALVVRYDGDDIVLPTSSDAEWRTVTEEREVVVERTDTTNTVKVTVSELVEIDVKVTPITEEEDRAHGYHLPAGDAFAHLETQFKFKGLSDQVEGILGQTYRPDYVSPVKKGVPMPMMGGEDRYRTAGFLSTQCGSCRFRRVAGVTMVDGSSNADVLVQ